MDSDGYEHAIMSKVSYDYHLESPEFAQNELEEYGYDDYIIDNEFSDDHAVTIVKPDGSAVISYRGTNPNLLQKSADYDLMADSLIFGGYHQSPSMQFAVNYLADSIGTQTRFVRAENHYKKVKDLYDSVTVTGHSLGGRLASYVGRKYNEKTYMYNKGSSPLIDPFFAGSGKFPNHKHYTTGTDPISYGSIFDKSETLIDIPEPEENFDYITHSLNYFLPKKIGKKSKDGKNIISPEPTYLMPIRKKDGKRINFCQLFPNDELCKGEGS
jgi:hypothetical protein